MPTHVDDPESYRARPCHDVKDLLGLKQPRRDGVRRTGLVGGPAEKLDRGGHAVWPSLCDQHLPAEPGSVSVDEADGEVAGVNVECRTGFTRGAAKGDAESVIVDVDRRPDR